MEFFKRGERRRLGRTAHLLYVRVIEQSRLPDFYLRLGVPDTLDGRFDLIVLHMVLVMRRLKADDTARELSQALFDLMFADMDQNLRELGVSDMSVGKRVKQMARAFYGRIAAYEEGLAGQGLDAALTRNLYGTLAQAPADTTLAAMARYVAACAHTLDEQPLADLRDGRLDFPAPQVPA